MTAKCRQGGSLPGRGRRWLRRRREGSGCAERTGEGEFDGYFTRQLGILEDILVRRVAYDDDLPNLLRAAAAVLCECPAPSI